MEKPLLRFVSNGARSRKPALRSEASLLFEFSLDYDYATSRNGAVLSDCSGSRCKGRFRFDEESRLLDAPRREADTAVETLSGGAGPASLREVGIHSSNLVLAESQNDDALSRLTTKRRSFGHRRRSRSQRGQSLAWVFPDRRSQCRTPSSTHDVLITGSVEP